MAAPPEFQLDLGQTPLTALKVTQFNLRKNAELLAWSLDADGKKGGAKLLRNAVSVFDAGTAAFDAFDGLGSATGVASAKKTLLMQSGRFRAELARLNEQLMSFQDMSPQDLSPSMRLP